MDELSAKRRQRLIKELGGEVGYHLRQLSRLYDTHQLANHPHAVVSILISTNGPEVTWAGDVSSSRELRFAAHALLEAVSASDRGEDTHEAVDAMVKRVRQYEQAQSDRIAEREHTHPFKCSHPNCRDRFKSKGALTRHERHDCRWFKYDREEG